MASAEQKSGRSASAGPVQSLDRGLDLLERLAASPGGATLTDLSRDAGLAPSTVHRLLKSLAVRRFARQDAETGRWTVGVAAFSVGAAFSAGRDYVASARAVMRRLVDRAGETANLAVADGAEAVYLVQVECEAMMRAFARPGSRVPLHCSAVGKALMAARPEPEGRRWAAGGGFVRLTERTVTDPVAVAAELEATRRRGFAIDDEEHAVGLRCVAAAVFDAEARPLAAISVSGPAARIPGARLEALGALVARAADDVTAETGGRRPLG
jgi:IclR family acetate operon transcriptional repressor